MNRTSILSKLMMGIASIGLSAGVWASSSNTIEDTWNATWDATAATWDATKDTGKMAASWGWGMDGKNDPEYMVTDADTHQVKFLDGVDKGHKVADDGSMMHNYDCMKGDKLTNLKTHKSGIIKGVKHQGTMDVMTPSGKTVRYQYVTFKVKPVK
ncbi:MAG: hypothetical protein P1U32_03045 [Legionellaceae bacterium]|nr:hypothetical protein [Legionellaceae bacterium]